jgi:hypothetical protein
MNIFGGVEEGGILQSLVKLMGLQSPKSAFYEIVVSGELPFHRIATFGGLHRAL